MLAVSLPGEGRLAAVGCWPTAASVDREAVIVWIENYYLHANVKNTTQSHCATKWCPPHKKILQVREMRKESVEQHFFLSKISNFFRVMLIKCQAALHANQYTLRT